jgi:hypothetical protein
LYCEPIGRGTDIKKAIEHLSRTAKRRSVVFLVSDFQDTDYEKALRVAQRKHDIIPVVVADRRESEMPNVGIIELEDAENGQKVLFDTSNRKHREMYKQRMGQIAEARKAMFTKLKMDPIYLYTGEDMIDPLRRFFHKREARR